MPEEMEREFEIITGASNVILVAPHGHMSSNYKDDEQTAELTRKIQTILNCYAVINEVYRKDRKDEPTFDEALKICNLNHIDYYEHTPLYNAFVGPIKQFKEEIIKRGETPYIFHIHGASSEKFKAACEKVNPDTPVEVDILIGTGRDHSHKKIKESLSAPTKKVDELIAYLAEEKIEAHSTDHPGYTAKEHHNLNQLFKLRYPDDNVISFQLEIRKKHFRDTADNVETVAEKLALAIRQLPGIVAVVEQAKDAGKEVAIALGMEPHPEPEKRPEEPLEQLKEPGLDK